MLTLIGYSCGQSAPHTRRAACRFKSEYLIQARKIAGEQEGELTPSKQRREYRSQLRAEKRMRDATSPCPGRGMWPRYTLPTLQQTLLFTFGGVHPDAAAATVVHAALAGAAGPFGILLPGVHAGNAISSPVQ